MSRTLRYAFLLSIVTLALLAVAAPPCLAGTPAAAPAVQAAAAPAVPACTAAADLATVLGAPAAETAPPAPEWMAKKGYCHCGCGPATCHTSADCGGASCDQFPSCC